jgi:hypothetical protein
MQRYNNHTFTSDLLTDKILIKMERLKINRSQIIRNCIKEYYFKEIRPLELRNRHEAKNADCVF